MIMFKYFNAVNDCRVHKVPYIYILYLFIYIYCVCIRVYICNVNEEKIEDSHTHLYTKGHDEKKTLATSHTEQNLHEIIILKSASFARVLCLCVSVSRRFLKTACNDNILF